MQKYDHYVDLARETLENTMSSNETWIAYLNTASRMYKYSFDEQLLIHAQRPETAACATFDFWTNPDKMNMDIARGSKGIALIDRTNGKLRYVYAVEDTKVKSNGLSKNPEDVRWKMHSEDKKIILDMISENYGLKTDSIAKGLVGMAAMNTERFMTKYSEAIKEKSLSLGINWTSEMNTEFKEFIQVSTAYMLLKRCDLPAESIIKSSAFKVDSFDKAYYSLIGQALNVCAKNAIRIVENEITVEKGSRENEQRRTVTKDTNRERDNIHIGRGDTDISSVHGNSERTGNPDREIRQDERKVSAGEQGHVIHGNGAVEFTNAASEGNRRSGMEENRSDSKTDGRDGRYGRTAEENGSAEVGRSDEQLQTVSRGNSSSGTDIQLSEDEAVSEKVSDAAFSVSENIKSSSNADEDISILEEIMDAEDDLKALINQNIEYENIEYNVTDVRNSSNGKIIDMQDLKSDVTRTITEDDLYENGFTILREAANIKSKNVADEKIDFTRSEEILTVGGPKTRYKANIEAITLLNTIESENRMASPKEQQILSKYVGWGGIAQAFDPTNEIWAKEYKELKEILSPEEYESARASVNTAFYTAPEVIESIYSALTNNGFTGGKVLEPAMGIGNFYSLMPDNMRSESKLYGVELDSISGRIAKQLYQNADIQIKGFEKTEFNDNSFDLAIGNVPFGGFKLAEKRYDKFNFNIHDHFFAKSLDKVKPGGIVAFVTSTGTLDKNNPDVRKYLAKRADLIAAIRLPSGAFKASAGTDTSSDIIFLQKKENPIETEPDWVYLGKNENDLPINQYFADHPEMVLGEIVQGNKLYGREGTMCVPFKDRDLRELLSEAIKNVKFNVSEKILTEPEIMPDIPEIPEGTKNFSYVTVDNKLYYRDGLSMIPYKGNDKNRITALTEIRDELRNLISLQLENASLNDIDDSQKRLNSLYDDFVRKYDYISDPVNQKLFREDISLPLLSSLEIVSENKVEKAPIFTTRTINPQIEVTHVDTATEALAVSLSKKAKVDLNYMSILSGISNEELVAQLQGVIFENPMKKDDTGEPVYENADEYLSGNIRKKLDFLNKNYPDQYQINKNALSAVMPKRVEAGDIDVKLGATWIDPKYVQQFMYELLQTPLYMQQRKFSGNNVINVQFSEYTATWKITNKTLDKDNVLANTTYGTERRNAYQLIEESLNLRDAKVSDPVEREGKKVYITNFKETELAQEKQKSLQKAFKEWIFKDPARRDDLVEKYNIIFNSCRPREYDGSHLEFSGMNAEIKLKDHQKNAIAHALYGGNTLFAHEVGAGKTFEMIATAMEGKKLGLHHKSLIAVPNHLTEQMGNDFLKLYPNANILVAKSEDFQKDKRQRLFAKIATGDFDAIIIGHSQLVKIPVSRENQERFIKAQIKAVSDSLIQMKIENNERFLVKQIEKNKGELDAKLQKLLSSPIRDDVINFEELGIDKMFIDEAHLFKNLFLTTKLSNISGISANDDVQKTADLQVKCQYLDELTGYKGIVFATGTPVSNSISEIYSMQKYLQADVLIERGLMHFDAWAANFAETATENQLSPEGNGYQMKTRFSNFNNIPELMNMFKECADIKTIDMLNLPVPNCETTTIVAQPTAAQKAMIENLGERAKKIRNHKVDRKDDSMVMITNDGRKIGMDQRLINPELPDEPGTKINLCVDNVYRIWKENADKCSTQLIFSDLGVPQTSAEKKKKGEKFCVYDDIKKKLIEKGIPANQIAFIHDAKSEKAKDKLFSDVRKGKVRVLIGSTTKMGAGTNVQDKLIASHDLDAPWKPSDMEQRRGRMVRRGNTNENVYLYRYVTEGTFDAYLYQMLENKQKFISQIMTSRSPVRSCEDVDDITLSFAEVKALSAGNPLIKEKMDLDIEVTKLKMLKANHQNDQYKIEDDVTRRLPKQISELENRINALKKDCDTAAAIPSGKDENGNNVFNGMKVGDRTLYDKAEAGAALLHTVRQTALAPSVFSNVGEYNGFKINAKFDPDKRVFKGELKGSAAHAFEFGTSEIGNITRLDNILKDMNKTLEEAKIALEGIKNQLESEKSELGKPFDRENELSEKTARLTELNMMLDMNNDRKDYYIVVSEAEIIELKKTGIEFECKKANDQMIIKIDAKDKNTVEGILKIDDINKRSPKL